MEELVYPAVFYFDEEYNDYAVEFCDVCIYTEGDTMQDAFKNAQKYLRAYLKCCKELSVKPTTPTDFDKVKATHKNGKVLLVSAPYENVQAKKKDTFSSLNDDIVEDIDKLDSTVFDESQPASLDDRLNAIKKRDDWTQNFFKQASKIKICKAYHQRLTIFAFAKKRTQQNGVNPKSWTKN